MSLPAALAVPRVSQTNSPTSLPFDHYRGEATGLQVLGPGLCQAVAEPVRLGGGSALAVKSWPVEQVKCAPPPAPREWRENKIAAADKPGVVTIVKVASFRSDVIKLLHKYLCQRFG